MLEIKVAAEESFNDETQQFIIGEPTVLRLEHSLVSVSKWESKWQKPFLSNEKKTTEETYDYIRAMCLGEEELPEEVLLRLDDSNLTSINKYIESKMTATWFNETKRPGRVSSEMITAELIYHWMFALQIPIECENWHLNRLITLIKVINEKNAEASKNNKNRPLTRAELDKRRALNEARRAEMEASN